VAHGKPSPPTCPPFVCPCPRALARLSVAGMATDIRFGWEMWIHARTHARTHAHRAPHRPSSIGRNPREVTERTKRSVIER
jgi:hypothetical protein